MAFLKTALPTVYFDDDRGITVRTGGSKFRADGGVSFPIIVFEHADWRLTLGFRCHSFDHTYHYPVDENGTVRTEITYGEHPRRVLALAQNIPPVDDDGRPLPADIRDIIREGAPLHYFGDSDFPGATEIYLGERLHASN